VKNIFFNKKEATLIVDHKHLQKGLFLWWG